MSRKNLSHLRRRTWMLLCLLILSPSVAGAQRRSVSGTVLDRTGQPVEGAVVKLKCAITLQVRSYITQGDGHYEFHGLHPDMDYSIRARLDGRSSKRQEITRFDSRESIRMDLRLDVDVADREQ